MYTLTSIKRACLRGLLGCLLISSLPLQASATLQLPTEFEQIQKELQATEKLGDIYERAEALELVKVSLDKALEAQPGAIEGKILRVIYLLKLADLKTEFGTSAIDYWQYISEEVDPLRDQAQTEIRQILQTPQPEALKAWALFVRAQVAKSWEDQPVEEIFKDLTESCKLGHQPACEEIHEQQKNH